MKKEFAPVDVAWLLVISVFTYFLIFWEWLNKIFVREVTGFAIALCIGAAFFLGGILLRRKAISLKKLVLGSIFIPYFYR